MLGTQLDPWLEMCTKQEEGLNWGRPISCHLHLDSKSPKSWVPQTTVLEEKGVWE